MPIKKQQNLNFTFNFHDKCRLSFREMITRRQCCHQSFDQIGAFFIGTLANQEFIKEESQCSGIFLDQVRHPRFEDMFSDQGSAWSIRLHKFSQKSKLSNRKKSLNDCITNFALWFDNKNLKWSIFAHTGSQFTQRKCNYV